MWSRVEQGRPKSTKRPRRIQIRTTDAGTFMPTDSRLTLATLLWLGLASAANASGEPPEQLWLGEFTVAGKSTAMLVHPRYEATDATSTVDLPTMKAQDVPLTGITFTAAHAGFQFQGGPDLYTFDGTREDRKLSGTMLQGKQPGTFTLVQALPADRATADRFAGSYEIAPDRVIDLGPMDEAGGMLVFIDHKTLRDGPLYQLTPGKFVAGPSVGVPYPFVIHADFVTDDAGAVTGLRWSDGGKESVARKIAPHTIEPVTVVNGDVVLKGTLTLPASAGPHPAIIFAHGSGASTRNVGIWNMYFVRLGFAVLSLDKRGAGTSGGDWQASGMDDIADDWLAAARLLRQRPDIDPRRIGVHGSSQGGWTAALMAARSPDIAFVIVRAGSALGVRDTMVHEIGWAVREAGLSESDAREAETSSRRLFDLAPRPWEEFSAAATPMKAKAWAPYAWPVNLTQQGWGKRWSALNAPFDPASTLAQVKVPVLWFLGALDHNVPSAESQQRLIAARKASGNKDFTIVMLPDAGHNFLHTTTGNNSEFIHATRMSAGYWDAMEKWLAKHKFSQPDRARR